MEKRYQVFVSSTYEDLQDERREVMQALLELDCIPSGMELFPAANEDQWTLIKKVIDDCDYYLVVIAGRYGSVGSAGLSFTEMEYRYALEQGKPIIAFVHKDIGKLPSERTEQDAAKKAKLIQFRELAQQKVVRYWSSAAELGSVVSRSVVRLTKTHPAVGWVRADRVPDEGANAEILRLRREIENLTAQLQLTKIEGPAGTESLAQGDDQIRVRYTFVVRDKSYKSSRFEDKLDLTWNQVFARVSPSLIDEATERTIASTISSLIAEHEYGMWKDAYPDHQVSDFYITQEDFQTIIVQFRALGLIAKSSRQRSLKDTATYWTLTPYGDSVMTRLRAISRSGDKPPERDQVAAKSR